MVEARCIWQSERMQPAVAILWFLPSIVFGVGTVITILALRHAPEGYESEEGFQYLHLSDAARVAGTREAANVAHPTGAGLA
jgi:hypothetical protein